MNVKLPQICEVWQTWFNRLKTLRVSKSKGEAPHKPLLLLVVLDMIEEGMLGDGILHRDGNLAFRFSSYWSIIAYRRSSKPDVKLPFYHLNTAEVWLPLDAEGRFTTARELAVAAQMNEGFLSCASNAEFRLLARQILIDTYFEPQEQLTLCRLLDIPPWMPGEVVSESLRLAVKVETERKRDVQFSLRVLPAYDFTCALTLYRMVAVDGTTAVDAAHIKQFKQGGPNCPTNGLALSKTAHWLFDRGFWSIGDDYRVLVRAAHFEETGEAAHLFKPRVGKPILLPRNQTLYPAREYLAWHRDRHGFGNGSKKQ